MSFLTLNLLRRNLLIISFVCLKLKLHWKNTIVQKRVLSRDGLREQRKSFPANDGEIYAIGGNTRTKILKESACVEVPLMA